MISCAVDLHSHNPFFSMPTPLRPPLHQPPSAFRLDLSPRNTLNAHLNSPSTPTTTTTRNPVALCVHPSFRKTRFNSNSVANGGPPRWFSPLECGRRAAGSPLLLFLPGLDGDGLGLKLHHEKLGLYINRTPLSDLVGLVERTIRSEHELAPGRPVYLVGESFGASLALAVAARNSGIDLVLILANPASSINKSLLQSAVPLRDLMYKYMQSGPPMSLMPVDTILWKLRMINDMQMILDSHLHVITAQTLILTSGTDMVLSKMTEGERLQSMLQRCDIRSFIGKDDPLFSDDTFDLVATIKGTYYYRRGASINHVMDFLPPTPSEYKKAYELFRWIDVVFSPAMFSTTSSGKVVRGLSGIPSEGPVLLVGNHMMAGMDAVPLASRLWFDRKILVRGLTHPAIFSRLKEGKLPKLSLFDFLRHNGAVPVSATNMYKLLSLKCHVLLYPGGTREVLHRKGEEYKLMWPAEPEFVRMAARFGAKIVPFGTVGEDDMLQLVLDFNDQMMIPPLKAFNEELTSEAVSLRADTGGEVGNQVLHYPICLPKIPGRLYFLFGKPISTQGRKDILRDKDRAQEMYVEIQREIEKCIGYLQVKREKDPYRNILPRLAYMGFHGFDCQFPAFEI